VFELFQVAIPERDARPSSMLPGSSWEWRPYLSVCLTWQDRPFAFLHGHGWALFSPWVKGGILAKLPLVSA
jgi:hypothetical protein